MRARVCARVCVCVRGGGGGLEHYGKVAQLN